MCGKCVVWGSVLCFNVFSMVSAEGGCRQHLLVMCGKLYLILCFVFAESMCVMSVFL